MCHLIVSGEVERFSPTFWVAGWPSPHRDLTYVALANWFIIIINNVGGPTDDKPTVTLETPREPERVSSPLSVRVTDILAVYAGWSARGAEFLTPPSGTSSRLAATSTIPTTS